MKNKVVAVMILTLLMSGCGNIRVDLSHGVTPIVEVVDSEESENNGSDVKGENFVENQGDGESLFSPEFLEEMLEDEEEAWEMTEEVVGEYSVMLKSNSMEFKESFYDGGYIVTDLQSEDVYVSSYQILVEIMLDNPSYIIVNSVLTDQNDILKVIYFNENLNCYCVLYSNLETECVLKLEYLSEELVEVLDEHLMVDFVK